MLITKLRNFARQLVDDVYQSHLDKFSELLDQHCIKEAFFRPLPTRTEKLLLIKESLLAKVGYVPRNLTINFLISSAAEIRVFEPIVRQLESMTSIRVYIYYLNQFHFSEDVEALIGRCSNMTMAINHHSLIKSCQYGRNSINVICLDHQLTYKSHKLGVDIINAINAKGGRTVCLQHGSTRRDNIEGHKTASSKFQIVWGTYLCDALVREGGFSKTKVLVTGNPLHDSLSWIEPDTTLIKLDGYLQSLGIYRNGRQIITVATCLHTEYDDRQNPSVQYRRYIRKIYDSIDFKKFILIVKMHPADTTEPNIYLEQLDAELATDVALFPSGNQPFSIYELIKISSLLLTRASTVAEESLISGIKVLAFDLFEDGPVRGLDFLQRHPNFEVETESDSDLNKRIFELINRPFVSSFNNEKFLRGVTYKLDGNSSKESVRHCSAWHCNELNQI